MSGIDESQDMASRLTRRGLRDQVYDLILDMLTEATIEPGARLSIDRLAADLRVSPTPVREALIHVERTGLITREIHKGYRVAPPLSDAQLEDLFDARIVLESGAVELAARHRDSLLPRLSEALDDQRSLARELRGSRADDTAFPQDVLRRYYSADWQFHRVIFEETQNAFLLDMSDGISTRVHRLRQVARTGVPDDDAAIKEHESILRAFRQDAPHAAQSAMRDHIEQVRLRAQQDARTAALHAGRGVTA